MGGLYFALNVAVVSVPLAFSWHPKLRFVDHWRAFLPACLVVAAGFVAWDVLFTAWGIWGFDDRYLLGARLAGLPVEEWLFFVCIPYACVFTYHAFGRLGVDGPGPRAARLVSVAAISLCAVLVLLFPSRLYTAATAALLAVFLAGLLWIRPAWLGRFWTVLAILAVPFVLSNGVLTGIGFWQYPLLNTAPEGIADQVVWYADAHTLGIRLFSIPLDDFLYATLLIGLNVAGFEWLEARRSTGDG